MKPSGCSPDREWLHLRMSEDMSQSLEELGKHGKNLSIRKVSLTMVEYKPRRIKILFSSKQISCQVTGVTFWNGNGCKKISTKYRKFQSPPLHCFFMRCQRFQDLQNVVSSELLKNVHWLFSRCQGAGTKVSTNLRGTNKWCFKLRFKSPRQEIQNGPGWSCLPCSIFFLHKNLGINKNPQNWNGMALLIILK